MTPIRKKHGYFFSVKSKIVWLIFLSMEIDLLWPVAQVYKVRQKIWNSLDFRSNFFWGMKGTK